MKDVTGKYKSTLDEKGRLNIPAKIRDALGKSFRLAKPLDDAPCISIYTDDAWEDIVKDIMNRPREETHNIKRDVFSSVFQVEQKQGRILIDQDLRDHANLEGETVIACLYDTVEIWSKKEWENRKKK